MNRRRIEIPSIYDVNTGNRLIIVALEYDEKNNIVQVEHWNGTECVIYERGGFMVDDDVASSYDEKNDFKNLQQGLTNFTEMCKNLEDCRLNQLLDLYGSIAVLINKSMGKYANEIAYPAQNLQSYLQEKIIFLLGKSNKIPN